MPADRLIHPKLGHSEKVSHLSDFEFRVWIQYVLSADDFGVVRGSAVTLQADNDAIACRAPKAVQKAIDHIVSKGLVKTFKHQGWMYLCQPDWQDFQKVTYPSRTINPKPPADVLNGFTDATKYLFTIHPGARKLPARTSGATTEELPKNSGATTEELSSSHARLPAKRLTANGTRLVANGSEGGPGETDPPVDAWARELVTRYPAQGRCGWHLVERPLFDAVLAHGDGPWAGWEAVKGALEQHRGSHQWRVKQMIPRLDKWLREGIYLQELPETPVATLVSEKTARTLSSAAQFIKAGGE